MMGSDGTMIGGERLKELYKFLEILITDVTPIDIFDFTPRNMRLRFLWFLVVFATIIPIDTERVMMGINTFKHEQNIGTVLFEKSDSLKHCWTTEDFVILNSRRMFQDLLPKVKVIDYENDRYIALLMDYFHICLESVRKLSIGKTKHLMLKALADTVGGYLQVYILPLTRHSYYAGNIKYRNARKLFELYDELKIFLRTNGAGWTKPKEGLAKQAKIPPIVITPPKTSVACNGIITYPASSATSGNEAVQHFAYNKMKKKKKRKKKRRLLPVSKRRFSRNPNAWRRDETDGDDETITVPLPFLDDDVQPNSIALPFKRDSLQSLYSDKSAFALVKYYVASVKCIVSKSKTKKDLEMFNKNLFDWLQQSIRRHLNDEEWYPAFGGVLRVIATLEESGIMGAAGITKLRKGGGTYQMMPKIGIEHTIDLDLEGVSPLYKGRGENGDGGVTFGTTELISIAVVSALLVWLLVGLSLVCYRFLTRHSDECSPCESQNPPVAVLYENTDYYSQPETHSSRTLKKGLLEKLKDWWSNKFGKCPAGCEDRYTDVERCLASINYTSKDTIDVSSSSKSCQ